MVDINKAQKAMEATPSVSILIVNYNGKHLLKECLSSISKLDYPKSCLDTKLIDNGSKDGSISYIKRSFPSVRVIKNRENNFCKANNLGIKESQSDFIALLNNDTVVDRRWLKELIKVIAPDKRIGCVGSKILFPDGRIQSTGHYEFPNFYWGDRGFNEPNLGQYEYLEEVSSLSGASLLFRRDCLEDVGYFDEDFVMYLEDVDIFLRCRQKNWKLLYVPNSIVYHKFHSTADEKLVRFYIERNRLLLIAKHFPAELSRALEHKEHSLLDGQVYNILPDIFTKLIKSHTLKTVEASVQGLFVTLQRLYNLSKDRAIQQLNNSLKESQVIQESLRQARTQLEIDITRRLEEINKLNQDIKKYELKRPYLNDIIVGKRNLEETLMMKTKELDSLKIELNNQHWRMELFQHDTAHKQEVYQEIEKQRNLLIEETRKRAEQINQLQEGIKQLDIERVRLQEAAKAKNGLEESLRQKTQETEALKVEFSKIQGQLGQLQQDFAHKDEAYQELETELKAKVDGLELEHLRLEGIFNEKTELEAVLKDKSTEIADLHGRFKEQQKQYELLEKDSLSRRYVLEGIKKDTDNLLFEINNNSLRIIELRNEIKTLEAERNNLKQQDDQKTRIMSVLETSLQKLNEKTEEIEKLAVSKRNLERLIDDKQKDIEVKDAKINTIYNSQTYKYLAIPVWRIVDFLKHIFRKKKADNCRKILIVKPFYVPCYLAENALTDLRNYFQDAQITLLANVFQPDYGRLKGNKQINFKFLFSPDCARLTKLGLLSLIFRLNFSHFDEAILLIGNPVYQGYRKAKLLAWVSGAKTVRLYFTATKAFAPLYSAGAVKKVTAIVFYLKNTIVFAGIILFFVTVIVLPLKIKKFFKK